MTSYRSGTTTITCILVTVRSSTNGGEDESVHEDSEHDRQNYKTFTVFHVSFRARLVVKLEVFLCLPREIKGCQAGGWETEYGQDTEETRVLDNVCTNVLLPNCSVLTLWRHSDYRSVGSVEHRLRSVNTWRRVPLHRSGTRATLARERRTKRGVMIRDEAGVNLKNKE